MINQNLSLSIIPNDRFIGVGSTGYVGIGSDSDWNWIADNIHAVQWDGTSGHVEYNDGTSEDGLTTIRDYIQGYIDWDKETERIALEELKSEEENIEAIQEFFGYSFFKAKEALNLLSQTDIDLIKLHLSTSKGGKI